MSMQINRSPIVWRTDQPTPRSPAKSFLPLLRAAVASHPGRPDLLCDLVIVLRDDRRWDEIFDLLSPLADGDGLTPALACELARAAIAGERPDIALRVVDSAIAQGVEGAARQKVLALYALCRFDEAQAAAQQVLREDPGDNWVLGAFGSDCLTRGDLDALISTCQWGIDCGASSSAYMAYLSTALAMAGRRSELGDVLDPAHLCARIDLSPEQVDNDALVQSILTHSALVQSPADKPTHGRNLRLEGLAGMAHPAIRNLLSIIRRHVDQYLADRFASAHPLIGRRPKAARLQGWALVLTDDGHEETHIHPQGWLTVIYYARVPQPPARVAQGDAPPPGSLVFGFWPPAFAGALPDFPSWHIEPKAGTLLIFPSFFGHGTIPTGVEEPRICVALDVIPCTAVPSP